MFNYNKYKRGQYNRKYRNKNFRNNNEQPHNEIKILRHKNNLTNTISNKNKKKKHKKTVRFSSKLVEKFEYESIVNNNEEKKIIDNNWDINFDVIELI